MLFIAHCRIKSYFYDDDDDLFLYLFINTLQFTLWSADAPDQCLSAKTATGVWALVIKKVNEVRQKDSSNAISGPEYYGFSNPLVREMIEELPNVDKCTKYKKN